MVSFASTKLHGGRTIADLPADFINARSERECPEHQEFYYHPDNEISMIIEVEGRFEGAESPEGSSSSNAQSPDLQAVDFHLKSLTDGEGPYTVLTPAHQVQMGKIDAPAYRLHARIEIANDPVEDENGEERAVTSCHMFLARLEKQQADVIVWVNVPGVAVGDSNVAEAVDKKDDIAACILDRLCESFEIGESGRWKIVEKRFLKRSDTGISMTVDQETGESNGPETMDLSDTKPLKLKSAMYKVKVFDLVEKELSDCSIPICLDGDSGVWGGFNWGKLQLVFFLSKPPAHIYRSEEDRCALKWRSVWGHIIRHGTGYISFHDGKIEGVFQDVILTEGGRPHECRFLGDVVHYIPSGIAGDLSKKWSSLEKED